MAPSKSRTESCGRRESLTRVAQAEAYLEVAELALAQGTATATPGVAASVAVLAGIAASDAACCAVLRRRARGQSHREAVSLLATVVPDGPAMAKDLQRLLDRKNDSHYGLGFVGATEATKMVKWASRLTQMAREVIESS